MNALKTRLSSHFAACATVAATVVAATAHDANAAVIHSGPVNISIPTTTAGVYLNVVTGLNGTAAATPGWDVNPWGSATLSFFNPAAPAGGVYVIGPDAGVDNLAVGTPIGAASTFGSGAAQTTGGTAMVVNSSDNIVGFRFQNEATGNTIHYGWMRISLSGTLIAQPRAIVEYAYESDAGASINAGAVPRSRRPRSAGPRWSRQQPSSSRCVIDCSVRDFVHSTWAALAAAHVLFHYPATP